MEKNYTIKEIANELNITRVWLHEILKPHKYLFKAPGNMYTQVRKSKYTEMERIFILYLWHNLPFTHRNKPTKSKS